MGAFARTLKTFQGTHILGASRCRLCDSKAFLYIMTVTILYAFVNILYEMKI